jgi:hypothetical protein
MRPLQNSFRLGTSPLAASFGRSQLLENPSPDIEVAGYLELPCRGQPVEEFSPDPTQ